MTPEQIAEARTCECGCGQAPPLARRTNSCWGHVKGKPIRYVPGHQGRPRTSAEERFWSRVARTDDGCWLWTGGGSEYGQIWWEGATANAHRVSWQLAHGRPVPDGLQIDHLCRNKWCVRPDHLEAVAPAENNRRSSSPSALNMRKVECPRGHPYDEANTYTDSLGRRSCRACRRARLVLYRLRVKARAEADAR